MEPSDICQRVVVFWFRRDLRLEDNSGLAAALAHAQKNRLKVVPLFIFDRDILDGLPAADRRVTFIHEQVLRLNAELQALGSGLRLCHGKPLGVFKQLVAEGVLPDAVFANTDYEPYARLRDTQVAQFLQQHGATFHAVKDHVVFHQTEVMVTAGRPYTVFTPYKKKWLATLGAGSGHPAQALQSAQSGTGRHVFSSRVSHFRPAPTLAEMGFEPQRVAFPSCEIDLALMAKYHAQRDFPALAGTSRLGLHLRFGTISVRALAQKALETNAVYLSELIWRDFYAQVLYHFPQVVGNAFRPEHDRIPWHDAEEAFLRWCTGTTGYPLVDAGMRELNATGYMHNRVRMVAASFLTKHLLMDWRKGEAYFALHLLDFDLASNNGGWQWAAGSGTDAAPYFRIFNPMEQARKFDPQGVYIRRWVPEFGTSRYPAPIVEHAFARARALETFRQALGRKP